MMKKRVKEGGALLLALALTFSALILPNVQAAEAVDTGKTCSIDFSIAGEYQDLETMGVPIKLYKVAAVDASGTYTAGPGFEGLDLSALEAGSAAADTWVKRAEAAAGMVTESTLPAASLVTTGGKATASNLETGMYLVAADEVMAANYSYSFAPYLVSLPNNYYGTGGPDEWVYDLTGANALSLKPKETELYGSLRIGKELLNQHVTMGPAASFVFQVDITTLKGKTSTKYITLTFDEAGTKSAVVEHIPAGSTVVVTEAYSGASYTQTGTVGPQETTILANGESTATFQNEHDGHLRGGYGVVNHFALDENNQYDWEKKNDNADAAE